MSRFPRIILSTSTLLGLLLICPIQSETTKSIPEKSLSHLDPIAIGFAHPIQPETTESTPKNFVSPIAINNTDPIRSEITKSIPEKYLSHLDPIAIDVAHPILPETTESTPKNFVNPIAISNTDPIRSKTTVKKILTGLVLPIAIDIAGQIPYLKNAIELWNCAEKIYHQFDGSSDPTDLMIKKIDILSQKMDHLESTIHDSRDEIIEAVHTSSEYEFFRKQRSEYNNAVWAVSRVFSQYLKHVADGSITSNSTRISLATAYLYGIENLDGLVQTAHYHLYGKEDSLLSILQKADFSQQLYFMCKTSKSIQQMIYEFYRKLVEAEVKVYALKLFLIGGYQNGSNQTSNQSANDTFVSNIAELTKITEYYLHGASREVRKCSPTNNLKGFHYVKFGPIFQKYIMNEHDSSHEKTRKELKISVYRSSVASYHRPCKTKLTQNSTDCSREEYACKSNVRDCKFAYDTGDYNICPLNKTIDGKERYERYSSVEYLASRFPESYKKVKAFENAGECTKSDNTPWGSVSLADTKRFGSCRSKICTCNDLNEKHLRFFDLRWVRADNNKVITGIRITPVNNTFYLQIKQGNLLPYGVVNGTGKWSNIDPLPPLFYTNETLKNDYMKLTYDRKTFWLGTYNAPHYISEFEIITGIRFAPTSDHSGIRLQASSKQFDFQTGELSDEFHNVFDHRVDQRKTIKLNGLDVPDNPNKKYINNDELDEGNGVLNLTQTDIDLDFGQNILPFVDIQPVETSPPTPLSGVGLFRRSSAGSGGYLAIKLITFDFHTTMKQPSK